jgi:hypothetical protein
VISVVALALNGLSAAEVRERAAALDELITDGLVEVVYDDAGQFRTIVDVRPPAPTLPALPWALA